MGIEITLRNKYTHSFEKHSRFGVIHSFNTWKIVYPKNFTKKHKNFENPTQSRKTSNLQFFQTCTCAKSDRSCQVIIFTPTLPSKSNIFLIFKSHFQIKPSSGIGIWYLICKILFLSFLKYRNTTETKIQLLIKKISQLLSHTHTHKGIN